MAFTLEAKQCNTCGRLKFLSEMRKVRTNKDGYANKCSQCTNTTYAKWCKENPSNRRKILARHRTKHPDRHRARWNVAEAVKSGQLIRPGTCSQCGTRCTPHGHHHDYTKPLEVTWLCQPCHAGKH